MAWYDGAAVRSGALTLEDGRFVAFPPFATSFAANLRAGVGGPASDPRAYVTWTGSSLELIVGVFDGDGALIRSPTPIGSAVQVVPVRIAGGAAGAVVGHAWDTDPYWDARGLSLDLSGGVQQEVIAEGVVSPEQTLGVSVSAGSEGRYAILYVVSDTHDARLRRFDAAGPLDAAPVDVIANAGGDYVPFSAAYSPGGEPAFLLLGVPTASPALGADLRLVHAPLAGGGVAVGPFLSELSPTFAGSAVDMAGLAGSPELAVVLWQEIELQDLEACVCTTPPPVRVDFLVQAVRAGEQPQSHGAAFLAYRWQDGDPIGPPATLPVVAPSPETPGRFTLVWSDGLLRYSTHDVAPTTAVEPGGPRPDALAALHPSFPNPFSSVATLRYFLRQPGAVRLMILDIKGREVVTLVRAERPAGEQAVEWDGRDARGAPVASGVYVARLEVGQETESRMLVHLR